ncbi:MAG TPA: hypothetical protein VI873_00980 [Candidatus Peribacteraceae bacterium]|nr:hypothetical protein [Candidatus Peribacteraceae bacterium]
MNLPLYNELNRDLVPPKEHPMSADLHGWMDLHRYSAQTLLDPSNSQKRRVIGCVDHRTVHANTMGVPGLGVLDARSPVEIEKYFDWVPRAIDKDEDIVWQTHYGCLAMEKFAKQENSRPEDMNRDWGQTLVKQYGGRYEHLTESQMLEPDHGSVPIVYLDATNRFSPKGPFPAGFRLSLPVRPDASMFQKICTNLWGVPDAFHRNVELIMEILKSKEVLMHATREAPGLTLAVVRDSRDKLSSGAVQAYAEKLCERWSKRIRLIAFDDQGKVYDREER